MPDIKTKFIPNSWGNIWEVYKDGILFATVADSELSETLQEIRDNYLMTG